VCNTLTSQLAGKPHTSERTPPPVGAFSIPTTYLGGPTPAQLRDLSLWYYVVMESYVKIRCSASQKQAWEQAAGLASVSTWARDALDRAARPAKVKPDVIRTPSEAAAIAKHYERSQRGQCRHGLVSCRVCQTGSYA